MTFPAPAVLPFIFPYNRAAGLGAPVFPARCDAEEGGEQQKEHGDQDGAVAVRHIIDKSVDGDQYDGGNRSAHGDFGKYFLVILPSVESQCQNRGQNHDSGAD